MTEKLRVGNISYTNLYPILYMLRQSLDPAEFEVYPSFPAELNRMMRLGEMDISPSSSIEYLRNERLYDLIEGHSISAKGRVRSVLLWSRVPIASLDGHHVHATHQSETSVALLKVIFAEFLGIACEVRVTDSPFEAALSAHTAYLSIGDEALEAVRDSELIEPPLKGVSYRLATVSRQRFYVYDLGELWHRHTGKPFVYALWIVRKGLSPEKKALLGKFRALLDLARDGAPGRFELIAQGEGLVLPPPDLVEYWRTLDYGLGPENLEGLALFRVYLMKLGLI